MEKFEQAEINISEAEVQQMIKDLQVNFPERANAAEKIVRKTTEEDSRDCLVFMNDKYQVVVRKMKPIPIASCDIAWLSIKRIDKGTIHDWRELQEIKNKIIGPEFEAVELYPAESRLVDTSNQYNLWVFLDPKFRFPVGFNERFVTDISIAGSRQRAFKQDLNIRPSKVKT